MNIVPQKPPIRQGVISDPHRPTRCPKCGREAPPGREFNRHDTIYRKRDGKVTERYRCIWPDCRKPFSVRVFDHEEVSSVQEDLVFAYAALQGTYRQLAEESGYSASTIWRWVNQACQQVGEWLRELARLVLEWLPGAPVRLVVREENRRAWFSRRIRKPGKIDQLLQLEQLPGWVQRCRETVLGVAKVAAGTLTFCQRVLPVLLG